MLLHDALSHVMLRIYGGWAISSLQLVWILTFFVIPNSCTIFANTITKLSPEWDYGIGSSVNGVSQLQYVHTSTTSTISNMMHSGLLSSSRWTVIATNALWFRDVHASVAKFSLLSYICITSVWSLAQGNICLPSTSWQLSARCMQKPFGHCMILLWLKVCNTLLVLSSLRTEIHDPLQSWRVEHFQKPSRWFQL